MNEDVRSPRPLPVEVRLRDGRVDDLDQVMTIMTGAFAQGFGERWTRSQCAGILPMSGVSLRLAQRGAGPADGFSLMRVAADEAELLLIAVRPEAQGQGLGRALLDDFIANARAGGAERLHLEVRDGNPAVALYRARGFVPAGRRRNYYKGGNGQQFDALTLVLAE